MHRVGSNLCYWLITESGKIVSKTSVEHVTRDDYLQAEAKATIDTFNQRLEEALDDANFAVDGEGEFESMYYLEDVEIDENPGIHHGDGENTPTANDYGDMNFENRPDDNKEEAMRALFMRR